MFEKSKATCVHLEEVHLRYLALMAILSGLNKSQYLRTLVDDDMNENSEICKQYSQILFADNPKSFFC